MNTSTVAKEINDSAIGLFVRLRAMDVTDTERKRFFDWLSAAREHQQAFVDILKMWEGLSIVKQMNFEELSPFPLLREFRREAELKPTS